MVEGVKSQESRVKSQKSRVKSQDKLLFPFSFPLYPLPFTLYQIHLIFIKMLYFSSKNCFLLAYIKKKLYFCAQIVSFNEQIHI